MTPGVPLRLAVQASPTSGSVGRLGRPAPPPLAQPLLDADKASEADTGRMHDDGVPPCPNDAWRQPKARARRRRAAPWRRLFLKKSHVTTTGCISTALMELTV